MTKDEVYDHLAQVYLGKRDNTEKKKPSRFDTKFIQHFTAMVLVLICVFYGLSAFLSHKSSEVQQSVIFALNNNPIRLKYNLNHPYPQISEFSIPIPKVNAAKYKSLSFSIRGLEEGYPGIVKIILKNKKSEESFYFVHGVDLKWRKFQIPLAEFRGISDWSNLTDVAFVFEAWNALKKKGIVLIDEICFAGGNVEGGESRSLTVAEK